MSCCTQVQRVLRNCNISSRAELLACSLGRHAITVLSVSVVMMLNIELAEIYEKILPTCYTELHSLITKPCASVYMPFLNFTARLWPYAISVSSEGYPCMLQGITEDISKLEDDQKTMDETQRQIDEIITYQQSRAVEQELKLKIDKVSQS